MQEKITPYEEYIDDTIPRPADAPDFLNEIITECELLAMLDDVVYYNYAELLDITCKNAYAAGEISKDLWDRCVSRYHQ